MNQFDIENGQNWFISKKFMSGKHTKIINFGTQHKMKQYIKKKI